MQQPSPSIPGAPSLAVILTGAGNNVELAQRIADGLRRQNVPGKGPIPWPLPPHAGPLEANCVMLVGDRAITAKELGSLLGSAPRLLALYPRPDGLRREDIVGPEGLALMAVAAKQEMSDREAGLFFPELFSELHTHCRTGISAAMLRFCFAKASRLAPNKAEIWV